MAFRERQLKQEEQEASLRRLQAQIQGQETEAQARFTQCGEALLLHLPATLHFHTASRQWLRSAPAVDGSGRLWRAAGPLARPPTALLMRSFSLVCAAAQEEKTRRATEQLAAQHRELSAREEKLNSRESRLNCSMSDVRPVLVPSTPNV